MGFFDVIKALLPLLLILGILYGALWYVKKYNFMPGGKKSGGFKIKVLGTQMLMPKKFISVVKVQDKVLVLGISDGSVNLLKELDPLEAEIDPDEPEIGRPAFSDLLKKNLGIK